ncbi:hypothetical protein HOY80DRAFT_1030136 [Tuber brumale]|nr:hypothetical protein HOY80DRAFT_1030136 [Tuber brumale]
MRDVECVVVWLEAIRAEVPSTLVEIIRERFSLANSPSQLCHLHTTRPNRSREEATSPPPLLLASPTRTIKPPVEEYVRIYLSSMATTYTLAGRRSANEDPTRGAAAAGRTHSHRSIHVVPDPASAIGESAHGTLSSPYIQFLVICARKCSNHQLAISLNPINSNMSDMDADVFLTGVMPGLYGQYLSSLTELGKSLGGDWVHGGDRGHPCDREVLDVWGGGAGVPVWRSVIEVEEEVRRDELSERKAKPIPGPDGKALPVAREGSRLRAVVAAGRITLTEKVPKLLDDTLFTPRVPNIYFKCQHHVAGATTEKNKGQGRKLYHLMIATSRLLQISGVLLVIEGGLRMCFEAITYAHSTISRHYINDVEEAFESLPARNAYGSANPAIEKGPGAIIAPCTSHEQRPTPAPGPTDGPQRKYYCGFSQCNESPVGRKCFLAAHRTFPLWQRLRNPNPVGISTIILRHLYV